MESLIQVAAISGCLIAIGVLVYARKLSKQVEQLKRDKYYIEQKLKALPKEMTDMVEPLRLQLAAVAGGKAVSIDLIREGRLYRDISVADAKENMVVNGWTEQKDVTVIDVRTAREYERGHVPGAKLIPIEELEQRYKAEIPMTENMVLVYCASGERSRLACDYLSRQGYLNLYNIHDGLQRWTGALEGTPQVNLVQIQSKTRMSESPGIRQ